MKKSIIVIIAVILLGIAWYFWFGADDEAKQEMQAYRTIEIIRRDLVQEISATGKISPIKEVEVGTQVTGEIVRLNADFNSRVKEGEIIAQIDPRTYAAAYDNAKARLKSNEASYAKTKVQLTLAEKDLERMSRLVEKKMVSESEYDNALANRDVLRATLQANEAAIAESKASVEQAETNLNYCTIVSPVTGIVISRDVDEGQTVVSNMNTSTLFKIATDLSRIQVEASVPEADVGGIRVGQKVTFTVDAYKDTFVGEVTQIRLSATSTSNVVTYPVIVEADNPDEKLFPGMTANLLIVTDEANNVISVPSAALRFVPDSETGEVDEAAIMAKTVASGSAVQEAPADKGTSGAPSMPESKEEIKTIWLWENNALRPCTVRLGVSNTIYQEVLNGDELEGKYAVVGKRRKSMSGASEKSNPFAPKFPGRGQQKKSNRQ